QAAGTQGELEVVASRVSDVAVEDIADGERGHHVRPESELPRWSHPRDHEAPGVAAGVGGKVPGAVVPEPPVHELRPGAVGVPVLVEVVARGQLPGLDLDAGPRLDARELVCPALDPLGV